MDKIEFIKPDWPAPENISCISTTRLGGFSRGKFSSLNLGNSVGDTEDCVSKNRKALIQQLKLKNQPRWLNQQHSNKAIYLSYNEIAEHKADAACSTTKGIACVVLTADCLPVVFCDQKGSCVAIAHAGWRGLLNGVLENTLSAMPTKNREVLCWLGAAIGPEKFEIGKDVKSAFVEKDPRNKQAFIRKENGKYLANIYKLAKNILLSYEVVNIYGGDRCTYTEKDQFFSYRRDGQTGRMATMIWINT